MTNFRKKTTLKIDGLQETIDELKQTIVTQELTRLREESRQFKEEKEDLANIKLKIKNVRFLHDDLGMPYVEVVYDATTLHIPVDEDGNLTRNEFFRSANRLNLLSQSDTERIRKVLNNIKKEN